MKFLLDENISPVICLTLHDLGHQARHVKDVGLLSVQDEVIFEFAARSGEIIITHDLDYSRIHAISGAAKPSVILVRMEPVSNDLISAFLKDNIEQIKNELERGVFVVVESDYIRLRSLPIKKGTL